MKILVTGATGFVGSHLCRRLLRDGHPVTILRRSSSDTTILKGLDLNQVIGDVTDADAVVRAVQGQAVVIHAAAHLTYWRRVHDVQTAINVGGTQNVAEACQHFRARLVHVSSVAAIGIPTDQNHRADESFMFNLEQSGLNYHLSKKRAEEVVLQAVANGLDAVIVNPGAGFGPFGKRFRGGEAPSKVQRSKVVSYFLGGINVVHVDDVVDGIVRALQHGRTGERYILGGENWTWRQISECAATLLGVKRIFVPVPSFVTSIASSILEPISNVTGKRPRITHDTHYLAGRFQFYDSSKAQQELGYSPRGYRDIVREFFAWSRSQH